MRNVAVNLTTGGGNADDRSGRGAAVPFAMFAIMKCGSNSASVDIYLCG